MILCTLSSLFMVLANARKESSLISGRRDFQAPVLLEKDLTLRSTVSLGSFWDPIRTEIPPSNPNLVFSGSKKQNKTRWPLPQAKLEASTSHQQSMMCSQSCRKMSNSAAVWIIAQFLDHSGNVSDCGTQEWFTTGFALFLGFVLRKVENITRLNFKNVLYPLVKSTCSQWCNRNDYWSCILTALSDLETCWYRVDINETLSVSDIEILSVSVDQGLKFVWLTVIQQFLQLWWDIGGFVL